MAARASAERAEAQVVSSRQWRAWLQEHAPSGKGCWVVTWRKASGQPVLTYDELVEEALCVGWVDSRPRKVDDRRTALLMTPRMPGSGWSRPNKERIARLEAAGLMRPAGEAVVEAARADGSWELLDAVEALEEPPELVAALRCRPGRPSRVGRVPALGQARDPRVDRAGQDGSHSRPAGAGHRRARSSRRKGQPVATVSTVTVRRDPHAGPVPAAAWAVDAAARAGGRVAIFNGDRADGLDGGWTMDEGIWELMRAHILATIDDLADHAGTVALKTVVDLAQERYATHALFPKGRVRNYCTFTKVDLEARCEVERVVGRSPQRIMRWRPDEP